MLHPRPEQFIDRLPSFDRFAGVTDPANYYPLPDDWWLAVADIVGSTKAIADGRYKAVNMAGASVISAVLNALGHRDVPFVFGGDGALVAVSEADVANTRAALAAVRTWTTEELGLSLRAALVPMRDVRAHGHDARVARFQAAPEVVYAMFAGGGASWAEREMKAGRYMVEAAPAGTMPDLTGLSCRWDPIEAQNGEIVSIIVMPGEASTPPQFAGLVDDVVRVIDEQDRGGRPLSAESLTYSFPPKGLDYEARTVPRGQRLLKKAHVLFMSSVGYFLFRYNKRAGRFDPKIYKEDTVGNSDFRKFDDGLKLTVDIDGARFKRIEALLADARGKDLCRFGMHRQTSALMTCLAPSPLTRDHLHFIDGAAGGYAVAAANMKAAG